MSIISVRVPFNWEESTFNKIIKKTVNIDYEFVTFKRSGKMMKLGFIKITERVDPLLIIEALQRRIVKETGRNMTARIVAELPDVDTSLKPVQKTPKFNEKSKPLVRKSAMSAHRELLSEIQHKFNRLFDLSLVKTDHKLLLELSKQIFHRLRAVVQANPSVCRKPFTLTGAYRREHPHTTDLKFIVSTLHQLEEADGKPKTSVAKGDLIQITKSLTIGNLPFNDVTEACKKYTDTIIKKAQEHLATLKTETIDGVSPARQRVRDQLKKMAPYLPMIIRQVMSKHLVPKTVKFRSVRIYGEPFLPGQEVMRDILKSVHPQNVMRIQTMYNLLRFHVAASHYARVMEMDGKQIASGTCKLVVRSEETYFVTPNKIMTELFEQLFE